MEKKWRIHLLKAGRVLVFIAIIMCFVICFEAISDLKESNTKLTQDIEKITAELYEININIDDINQRIDEAENTAMIWKTD